MARTQIKQTVPQNNELVLSFVVEKKVSEKESFNFNLDRMREHVESETVEVPEFERFEDFEKWLAN